MRETNEPIKLKRSEVFVSRMVIFFCWLIFLIGCGTREAHPPAEQKTEVDSTAGEIPDDPAPAESSAGEETAAESASESEGLDAVFPKFQMGNLVFNAPDTMKFGEKRGIQLLLSPKLTVAELTTMIEESGELRQRRIRISRVMEASLSGSGFKIDPITAALQVVNPQGATEWRWEVTALETGMHKLYLTMNAILEVDGRELPHTIQTLHEVILVQVAWDQRVSAFVAENWKWLWTTIMVPLIGWLWERRKQRGKEKK
jgi:hypothetical protein